MEPSRRRIRPFNTTRLASLAGHWMAVQLGFGPDREKTLRFGLDIVFSWVAGIGLVLIISALLGAVIPAMAATSAALALRTFSAGAHCSTSGRCAILTAAVYPLIGKAALALAGRVGSGWIAGAYGAAGLMMFLRALPSDPRDTRNLRLRPVAVALLAVYLGLSLVSIRRTGAVEPVAVAVALGCLWQSVTVTPAGKWLVTAIDRWLCEAGVD